MPSAFGNLADKSVVCAFSSRSHGNMSLAHGDTSGALKNRRDFLAGLGIDYRDLTCARQVHAGRIERIRQGDKGRGALSYEGSIPDADALITDQRNVPLAVFTADCLPVFVYDQRHNAIGIIHAGWRGTKEKICARAISFMGQSFGTQPKDLLAGFGPAIRECCYEVGKDFQQAFAGYLRPRGGRYYLNLAAANRAQLQSCGVKENNISDAALCTSCLNKELFSFRKEGNLSGRMISVITLK